VASAVTTDRQRSRFDLILFPTSPPSLQQSSFVIKQFNTDYFFIQDRAISSSRVSSRIYSVADLSSPRSPPTLYHLTIITASQHPTTSKTTTTQYKMVILGGLELVAAGYLLREHAKNKRDRRDLRQEAETLEDTQYEVEQEERRRRRTHSHNGRHHHRPDSRERRHHYADPKPPYNPNLTYGSQPQGPPRPSSVPPMMQTTPNYPPTGWPAHWDQSHRPGPEHKYAPPPTPQNNNAYLSPNAVPNPGTVPPNYQYPQYGPHRATSPGARTPTPEKSATPVGGRRPQPYGPSASVPSPHVRFNVPGEGSSQRYDPPPAYQE